MESSVLFPTQYTPAITPAHRLLELVNGRASIDVRRMVLCTEDSVKEHEVPLALQTLRSVLAGMDPDSKVDVYVRVRTPEVMAHILALPGVEKLRGFVIPKADPASFPQYADQIKGAPDFWLMPILESPLMTDPHFRSTLLTVFMDVRYRHVIECLRIGANDLMGYLGIRRDTRRFTIYDTPVGTTIHNVINEFRGLGGFIITAPVFECFDAKYDDLLLREVAQHTMNGLFGQTVIHPRHLPILHNAYRVPASDLQSALEIIEGKKAVAGLNGRMDEPATHTLWAQRIIERHELFGDSTENHMLDRVFS